MPPSTPKTNLHSEKPALESDSYDLWDPYDLYGASPPRGTKRKASSSPPSAKKACPSPSESPSSPPHHKSVPPEPQDETCTLEVNAEASSFSDTETTCSNRKKHREVLERNVARLQEAFPTISPKAARQALLGVKLSMKRAVALVKGEKTSEILPKEGSSVGDVSGEASDTAVDVAVNVAVDVDNEVGAGEGEVVQKKVRYRY